MISYKHQITEVTIPDVNPIDLPQYGLFSMTAGDFLEVYRTPGMHVMYVYIYICIYLLVYRTPGMHVMYILCIMYIYWYACDVYMYNVRISSGVQDTSFACDVYIMYNVYNIFWCNVYTHVNLHVLCLCI